MTRYKILAAGLALAALAACSGQPVRDVPTPPELVEVPVYVPLPAECGEPVKVDLPPGTSAIGVMEAQSKAIDAANDQIARCFAAGRPQ